MTKLFVNSDTDFSGLILYDVNRIDFTNTTGSATAVLRIGQLHPYPVGVIDGSAGINAIVISAPGGGNGNSLAGWTFFNWGPGDTITINGSAGCDSITGSIKDDTMNGLAGNDWLHGGDGDDVLTGSFGNDGLTGDNGNDVLSGGAGADRLSGGLGDNTLNGGAGNDTISSTGGIDKIDGGGGVDAVEISHNTSIDLTVDISAGGGGIDIGDGTTISNVERLIFHGGSGNDTVTGGALDDVLDGGEGNDTLNGGAGNDRLISSGHGMDWIDGGSGADTAFISCSDSSVALTVDIGSGGGGVDIGNGTRLMNVEILHFYGGMGNDSATGGALADVLYGYGGNDWLNGNGGNDEIDGGDGNDILIGGAGHDGICGDVGNDTLDGGDGDDHLSGGEGNDILNGGAGNDVLDGDSGHYFYGASSGGIDTLNGGAGNDHITSDWDPDWIDGGTGTDYLNLFRSGSTADLTVDISAGGGGMNIGDGTLISNVEKLLFAGGSGNDIVTGGGLADELFGSYGNDTLNGGAGSDGLGGDDGNDVLNGGSGSDVLAGGAGRDILSGGGGADTFLFDYSAVDSGHDLITDFQQGSDKLSVFEIDAIAGGANDAFSFIGSAGFSGAAGELRFFQTASGNTIVEADTTGDGVADFQIACAGLIDFTAGDFVL